jgi:hypothetical protein
MHIFTDIYCGPKSFKMHKSSKWLNCTKFQYGSILEFDAIQELRLVITVRLMMTRYMGRNM